MRKQEACTSHPQPLQDPFWNYVVLGAAAIFEGISFAIALRQFKRLAGSTAFWEVTMDLDFDAGTETSVAAITMVEVERRIRLRFPMIKRLFIESGSSAVPQRWTRPDAIRTPAETLVTPDSAGEATNAP